jgi:hypothetical protein
VQGDVHRICWRPSKRRKFKVTHNIIFLFIFKYHVDQNYWFPFSVEKYLEYRGSFERRFWYGRQYILGQISTLDNLRKMNVLIVE